ncbi:MAG: ferrochelatase [Lautropia sp.]
MASRFTANHQFVHGAAPTTGVLLVQLGTPDDPEPGAVRRYLRQFLSDPRVVEIARPVWWPVLNGAVLTTRPRRSAEKYRAIWMTHGSPLAVHTQRQATLLRGALGEAGLDIGVAYAMRYGDPSIATVLRQLRERNLTRLLVLPLYPQYSGSTTGSAFDAVSDELRSWRNLPELRFVRGFHREPGYLEALAESIQRRWQRDGRAERLVISFHGLPRRTLTQGDPYHCECLATARLLAETLRLGDEDWIATFQSRFGRARWLEPYTQPTLVALAKQGVRKVDVVCPGFVADCLETLEEIAITARDAFLAAGGAELRYLECLNESPRWIDALVTLVSRQTAGWPVARLSDEIQRHREAALADREQRARKAGAPR